MGVQVITGISATHWLDPETGTLWVNLHALEVYFPEGTNIHDLHFYADGVYLGSVDFEEPMEPCVEYHCYADWWEAEFDEWEPEFIDIYLTDAAGEVWGKIASQPVPPK